MISNSWRLATVLGVAGAIAFSVPSAEARTKRKPVNVQSTVTAAPFASLPSHSGSYNYYAAPLSGGVNFRDGRNGANYNSNQ